MTAGSISLTPALDPGPEGRQAGLQSDRTLPYTLVMALNGRFSKCSSVLDILPYFHCWWLDLFADALGRSCHTSRSFWADAMTI